MLTAGAPERSLTCLLTLERINKQPNTDATRQTSRRWALATLDAPVSVDRSERQVELRSERQVELRMRADVRGFAGSLFPWFSVGSELSSAVSAKPQLKSGTIHWRQLMLLVCLHTKKMA
ncbi:MAG: hypothetical protein ACK56I_35335, partial [bacterium]